MRFFKNADYPFLEWRKRAYVLSAVVLLLGVGAMIYHAAIGRGWLNYGVDFTGGTIVQVNFNQPTSAEAVRSAAARGGYTDWEITRFGGTNEYVLRLPSFQQEVGRSAGDRVTAALSTQFPKNSFTIARVEAVGPKAGNELQGRALGAILLSFVATLIYLGARFEWRFGLAAIIATGHDILITLGFLALTRGEISLGTVAAILTVVGYSQHDTIIVFDRVRENLKKPLGGRSFIQLLDLSINETLPRTILTVGTVLATLLALLLFGGPVIREFVEVLTLGITVGTFSSIFVASPVLYEIEKRWPRHLKTAPQRPNTPATTPRVRSTV